MPIDVERNGYVATVTINRPDVLNAFNDEQLESLRDAVQSLGADTEIRAIVLTGAGERAFAAGADISQMRDKGPNEALAFAQLGQSVCAAIESVRQPVIAAINGYALGGGCEIALACDIRLAADNAVLGQPEVTLGIPPGWGGSQRLTRLVGPGLAKELIFTGRRLSADDALRIGLVNAVHPGGELLAQAQAMAGLIAGNGPLAVGFSKEAINRALDLPLDAGLAYEAQVFALSFDTADQKEGMDAFLNRRSPDFSGH